jgi:hypothetical protein
VSPYVNILTSRTTHLLGGDGRTLCGKTGWASKAAPVATFTVCPRCTDNDTKEPRMTITDPTTFDLAAVPVASQDDEEAWLDARAEGVTASEVPRLSPAAYARMLDDKLNGSTFRGNAHTRRGHERESEILADLTWILTAPVVPNRHVWAAKANPRHLATPDAFAVLPGGVIRGVEVKSHEHGWTPPAAGIPADHFDQVQWGMHVTGLDSWIYAWEVMEADGSVPTADPDHMVIWRDQTRIAELVERADAFLTWVDDGAPVEEISDELAAAKARLMDAKRAADEATAAEKAARAEFERLLRAEYPNAERTGWKHKGDDGTVTLARGARRTVLDEQAWADADPATYARYGDHVEAAEALAAGAREKYTKTTIAKPALRITIPKGASK